MVLPVPAEPVTPAAGPAPKALPAVCATCYVSVVGRVVEESGCVLVAGMVGGLGGVFGLPARRGLVWWWFVCRVGCVGVGVQSSSLLGVGAMLALCESVAHCAELPADEGWEEG